MRIHEHYGILTAAHVVDDLLGAKTPMIAIVCTEQVHQLMVHRDHTEVTRFGPNQTDSTIGPDLAFIRLLDPVVTSSLKAKKSFYPLSSSTCAIFDKIEPKNSATCCLTGAPAEIASEEGLRGTESHVLCNTHFAARAQVGGQVMAGGFDYLQMDVIAGRDSFPERYNGVSGGGVWHIPFAMNPEIGKSSMCYQRLELVGVAFHQSELIEESRIITCHGPRSIYERLVEQMPP